MELNGKNLVSRNNKFSVSNIVSILSLTTIIAGIATSIYMNSVNRSLWLDEAMLAYSFSKRSFLQLWNGPLEWLQSAPLGWLYFEKTLSLLFGNTEFTLRIGSILGYIFTIIVLYSLLKDFSFSPTICLSACAFYSNMPFILKYSNVFKPYIFDGFIILSTVFLFHRYEKGQLHIWILALIWAFFIWFSTPVCFLEGGLLIAAGLSCIIKKDYKNFKKFIFLGFVISISFALCYYFWLGDKSTVQGMQLYWKDQNFPLIPTSLADLKKMIRMTSEILKNFGRYKITIVFIATISFFLAIKQRQTAILGCYFGVLLSLFASWINMFPIEDRTWFFIYPLIIFLAFYGLNWLIQKKSKWEKLLLSLIVSTLFFPQYKASGTLLAFIVFFTLAELFQPDEEKNVQSILIIVFSLFLVFSVNGIQQFWNNADAVYWDGEELNPEIEYLENNLKSDECVYVFRFSVPGFQFKNGYNNESIGGFKSNISFGRCFFLSQDWKEVAPWLPSEDIDCEEEIDSIFNRDKVYIVSSHITSFLAERMINAAHDNGFLQLVSFEHQTPLWFFCRNIEDGKIQVSYKTKDMKKIGNRNIVTVLLKNEGPAYINHQFEDVYFVDSETGDFYSLPKNIKPGESVELTLTYDRTTTPLFRLENEFGLICADSEYSPMTHSYQF